MKVGTATILTYLHNCHSNTVYQFLSRGSGFFGVSSKISYNRKVQLVAHTSNSVIKLCATNVLPVGSINKVGALI